MPVNAGFRERIYIDGVQRLVLANGGQGRIIVPNGNHTIHAELYTLTTVKVPFTASSSTITFLVSPYSVSDFTIEQIDGVQTAAQSGYSPGSSVINDNGIEGSLARAAGKIMEKVSPKSRIAIVYVTARDQEIAEFIANELEFIMVEQGLTLIDRNQLDSIRKEQNFQLSGEVDDMQAVSIGKIAGANVILTGAVTGTGEIRRLRLRALDTQSAQVLAATSERY
jgi:pyrimidine operon attenuation protein/uracil phosphoribosyltransferase